MPEEHVAFLSLKNGHVMLRANRRAVARGLHLALGTEIYPPVPLTEGSRHLAPLAVVAGNQDGIEVMINHLPEWQVEGSCNLQLRISNRLRRRSILLGQPYHLPVLPPDQNGPLVFHVLVAAHRANAALRLDLCDASDISLAHCSLDLPQDQPGGRQRQNYQPLRLLLPLPAGASHARISLDYRGTDAFDYAYDPFVFLLDPLFSLGADLDGSLLRQAPDHPAMAWYQTQLPLPRPGSGALELVLGRVRHQLLAPVEPCIQPLRDLGHALSFRADRPVETRVYLDGRDHGGLRIETGECWLQLPVAVLTGDPTRFELRDATGCTILHEAWLLPPRSTTPAEVMQREGAMGLDARLFAASARRFAALRAHLQHGSPPEILAQLPQALAALEADPQSLQLLPLTLPGAAAPGSCPDVSIIIPAWNQIGLTYRCLCALLLAWNRASFEVILVDDGSDDATAQIETLVSGVRLLRHAKPLRFLHACNAGAALARGKYIVLLNNDTEPTTGWLDALLDAFERFADIGLAGAKLLYPDGRLQEAGGIIWGNGNPWNYGNGENPAAPQFCYARPVDYLSGAALMLPRELWQQLGGLNPDYAPMYFEDTDLAFRIRAGGHTAWYVPESVVYHQGGGSAGTDSSQGLKRHQELNRPRFKRDWAKAFASHGREGSNPDLEKDRGCLGRILVLDQSLPRPDRDAGGHAAVQEMRLMQSLGLKVTFLPENLADLGHYTTLLQRMGIEVVTAPFARSVQGFLQERGGEFDLFYITRHGVAEAVLPQLRQVNPAAKVLLNTADLHFLRSLRAALAQKDEQALVANGLLRRREMATLQAVDLVLSYSPIEQAVIQSHSSRAVPQALCPWVLTPPASLPPPRFGRQGLSFIGSFRHPPNVEALQWFASAVLPKLAQEQVLFVHGADTPEQITALQAPRIQLIGHVKKLSQAFDPYLIFIAPLQSGAGIKGKVLEALSHGIPTVLSPLAAEGIGLRHGQDCLIAESPADWCAAIQRLHEDAALWARIARRGRALVRAQYSFENGRDMLRRAFEAVGFYALRD